ncbi:hypothetical protein BASA81_018433 [Batrachochytrium salamandrivorans]|nr:hypothetical protein BASA81_018433 [Batrachochytrium salamandrivorans]
MRVKVLVAAAMVITSVNAGWIDKIANSIESVAKWVNDDYYWDSVVSEGESDEAQDSETTKQNPTDLSDFSDISDDDDNDDDPTKTRLLNDSNEPNDSDDSSEPNDSDDSSEPNDSDDSSEPNDSDDSDYSDDSDDDDNADAEKEKICAPIIAKLRESQRNCIGIAHRFNAQVMDLYDLKLRAKNLKPEKRGAHSALYLEARAGLKDTQKEFKAAKEGILLIRRY